LLPTLLWYRDKVRVLEPPELVEKMKDALSKISSGA
jgi:predicted DNA-binding transcriptional regulator YafY